jgi:hypothetical protein
VVAANSALCTSARLALIRAVTNGISVLGRLPIGAIVLFDPNELEIAAESVEPRPRRPQARRYLTLQRSLRMIIRTAGGLRNNELLAFGQSQKRSARDRKQKTFD